jgi:hypothetical protein
MDNSKGSLDKSSNIQRATRPGVVRIINDDNGSSVASVAAASHGEDREPPLPMHVMAPGPHRAVSPQPQVSDRAMANEGEGEADVHTGLRQQEEDVGIILPDAAAAETSSESPTELPPATNDCSEENAEYSQDRQQRQEEEQVLPQEREDGLLPEEEELVFDAEVELIGAGGDNNDDGDDHPATTTEEHRVTAVQLTQSSFPIAQPVNDFFEEGGGQVEEEEDDEESQLIIDEGGDDELLDESDNSDYTHEILLRQEVALAITDGRGEQDVERRDQNGGSSSREENGKKFRVFPTRRSSRIVCGVMGALAVVASVVGAVIVVSRENETKGVSDVTKDLEKDPTDLNIDENVNVVEVLLQSFLENTGTNEHRIPGRPQYRAIQWLYESAREGSERFNLSEWAIR